jgi:hypothetical protein
MLRHIEGKEEAPQLSSDESALKLAPKEEEHCIRAQKNFLKRAWHWIKDHKAGVLYTTISVVALAAIIGGLVALTIFFPHVMIPIWIGLGVLTGLTVVGGGFFMLAFAAGSGDRGAQTFLKAFAK